MTESDEETTQAKLLDSTENNNIPTNVSTSMGKSLKKKKSMPKTENLTLNTLGSAKKNETKKAKSICPTPKSSHCNVDSTLTKVTNKFDWS